ncbi:MAG: hypothetical protein ACK5V3_05890, partial [Bdellovibrionales bacterium]
FISFILFVAGCNSKFSMVSSPREPEFFQELINPASLSAQMPNKLEETQLLATGDEYPMRFVMFDNGQFFYQVDRLGEGYGTWSFQEGGVRLFANRKLFDMSIYLGASSDVGDEMQVRFLDRRGFQNVRIQHRDGTRAENREQKVREFSKSTKDI